MDLPTNGAWTLVTTTTVDTLMQARNSRIQVTTIDPATGDFNPDDSAVELTDHVQIRGLFVVPSGLSVWARCISASPAGTCTLAMIPFGV